MSSRKTERRRKPGSKSSATAGSRRKGNAQHPARADSLAAKLKETRDRWVAMSETVDVVQIALEKIDDVGLIVDSASSVLYRVLSQMHDEIQWLNELIELKPEGATIVATTPPGLESDSGSERTARWLAPGRVTREVTRGGQAE
jgi:hypothetical protein